MKRIIMFMALILCIFNVSALTLTNNQETNINDFFAKENGNSLIDSIAGSYSTTNNQSFGVGGLNGTFYFYDLDYEIASGSEDFYLVIQNSDVNETITIMHRGDLNRDPTLYIQNFTFNEIGRYYFKFSPEYENEPGRIFMEFPDAFVGTIEYIEQKPEGFSGLIGEVKDAAVSLIEVNIGLWKLGLYALITIMMITGVIALFGAGFLMLRYAKKMGGKE